MPDSIIPRIYTGEKQPSPQECELDGREPYIPSPELIEAVNLTIFLQKRPLLLKGEPGCGKTRLARAVADELGLHYESWYVQSTTRAKDGFYTYDAIARLQDAQLAQLDELDVAGTVEKNCCYGILPEPVMMSRYTNQVKLVLLIDQGGSMVPFHHLSHQLINKAERGGNIKQTSVYYFQNYPEKYLYSDPTRLKAQLITNVLESLDKKTSVLIVSDAGAARGNYNPERVEYTQKFIEQLQQSVNYYAWLNPMPNDSWQYTTAGEIARFVPMFEMSREGLSAAINTLRGRYVYWEHPYQWMLL